MPNAEWPRYYFHSFDRVLTGLQLMPLRDTELSPGQKEIRYWSGLSIGIPKTLHIVTKTDEIYDGKLVFYWDASNITRQPDGETTHDLMKYSMSGRCDQFRLKNNIGTCIGIFEEEPDWENIFHKLTQKNIWDLPDQSELKSDELIIDVDGWGLVVELRDSSHYRTYQYRNPHSRDWPEAAKAVEINAIFNSINRNVQPSDVTRSYRGITSGEYRSAFKKCDSNEVWAFRASGNIKVLAERAGIELPEPGDFGYLVEVFGEPTPEWLARSWNSDFIKELQTGRLISIVPATSPNCK